MARIKKTPKKKKKVVKKKRRRDVAKFSGLQKRFFSKIKQEYHDIDYINKLSDKEKEWLNSFMEEDLGARMNHSGKKIYKSVKKKRESYRRNNTRNRDMYSNLKAAGILDLQDTQEAIERFQQEYIDKHDVESKLIDMIDRKKLLKK